MTKIDRNAPCPCGSGRKYKKCCLGKNTVPANDIQYIPVYTDIDELSNSVVDLIAQKEFKEAEKACQKLLEEYPDQVDGLERYAMLYEKMGKKDKAVEYYKKAVDYARSNEGYDQGLIDMYLSKAKECKS